MMNTDEAEVVEVRPEIVAECYHKAMDPRGFARKCAMNRQLHMDAIARTRDELLISGVPERYIYVLQKNRCNLFGTLWALSDTASVERELDFIKNHASAVFVPDVYVFMCVDLRDQTTLRRYLSENYFHYSLIEEQLATIDGRTLVFDRETQPDAFDTQCDNNERRAHITITKQCKALKKQGVDDTHITVVIHTPANKYHYMRSTCHYVRSTSKARIEELVQTARHYDAQCYFPDPYTYTCVDIREHATDATDLQWLMGRLTLYESFSVQRETDHI